MELKDLVVTPIVIILVYVVAYLVRPFVTDEINRRYFLPALTVRIVGALALGFLYQFYYSGGDTYNYHTHGSRHVWEAFMDSPEKGFKLLFSDGKDMQGVYKYASRILFIRDSQSYTVVKIAAVADLLTFSAYSATAVLFSVFSFVGLWMLFSTFYRSYPHLHLQLAIAIFFIPSVFFWGSGLLKDTITLGCLGMVTYQINQLFIKKEFSFVNLGVLLLGLYLIYAIKIYILLTFLPAVAFWVVFNYYYKVPSLVTRAMLLPFVTVISFVLGYYAILKAGEDNPKYAIDKIAETAQVTAYDIRYWSGRDAGSGYSLGELDGSFNSMLMLAPAAINVSLFRPYLWEVKNPLMLLSSLESIFLAGLTIFVLYKARTKIFSALTRPDVLFCIIFSLAFAFAVGVSTFNFGTLTRYKIPLLPYYLIGLILIVDFAKGSTWRQANDLKTSR